MKFTTPAVMILSTLFASLALAHTDDVLDAQKAPNGGQMRMAGAYHYELVVAKDSKEAKDNPVVVYLTDHAGNKVQSAGATGSATLLAGKLKSSATLTPAGDNRLQGFAKYASEPEMKVVVSVTLPGKAAEQARFTPLQKKGRRRPTMAWQTLKACTSGKTPTHDVLRHGEKQKEEQKEARLDLCCWLLPARSATGRLAGVFSSQGGVSLRVIDEIEPGPYPMLST